MKPLKGKEKQVKSVKLTSIMEDYLEAIYELSRETGFARVKDIAQRLQVRMPTVTSMLKTLAEKEVIKYEKYGSVVLTRNGEEIGKATRARHDVLLSFLHDILKVDFDIANEEACIMEHALSSATLMKLTKFVESMLSKDNCKSEE